jgi:hypothetical protein
MHAYHFNCIFSWKTNNLFGRRKGNVAGKFLLAVSSELYLKRQENDYERELEVLTRQKSI